MVVKWAHMSNAQPENSGQKQETGRFRKGQSGNPAGKPRGARHRVTVLAEKLMEDDAEAVVRAVVDKAKAGDMSAAKLVLDRIAPPRKGRLVKFSLAEMSSADEIGSAVGAIACAMAKGELTPEEAASVAAVLEIRRKAFEVVEIEARLLTLGKLAEEQR